MEPDCRTATWFQHSRQDWLRGVLWLPRVAQPRSKHHSRTSLYGPFRLRQRKRRNDSSRRQVHPGCSETTLAGDYRTSESVPRRRLLLVCGREQQLQRIAIRGKPPLQSESAVPRKLHVGEEPRYELRVDDRASTKPAADDLRPYRSSSGLGRVGFDSNKPGEHLRSFRPALRFHQCKRSSKTDIGLAAQRHHVIVERLSVYSSSGIEQIRRRKHQKSRPAKLEHYVYRTGTGQETDAVVRPERLQSPSCRRIRKHRKRNTPGARPRRCGFLAS